MRCSRSAHGATRTERGAREVGGDKRTTRTRASQVAARRAGLSLQVHEFRAEREQQRVEQPAAAPLCRYSVCVELLEIARYQLIVRQYGADALAKAARIAALSWSACRLPSWRAAIASFGSIIKLGVTLISLRSGSTATNRLVPRNCVNSASAPTSEKVSARSTLAVSGWQDTTTRTSV